MNTLKELDELIHKDLVDYAKKSVENLKEFMVVTGMSKSHFMKEYGKIREQLEKECSFLVNGTLTTATGIDFNDMSNKLGLNIDYLKSVTMKQYIDSLNLDNRSINKFKQNG